MKNLGVGQECMHFWNTPEEKWSPNKQIAYVKQIVGKYAELLRYFFIEEQSHFLTTVKGTLS
jgi:hypothetical protein